MTKKEKTIKEVGNELEKIISKIENEQDQNLEETFSDIEKGVELLAQLQSKINKLENKFVDLKEKMKDN